MGDVQIIIHPSEDGRSLFWAESPQYPGCFTDGRTIDELLRNWQEASALWLEDADEAQREYLAPYYGKRRVARRTVSHRERVHA